MVLKCKLFVAATIAALGFSTSSIAQVYPEDILKYSKNYFESGAKAGADFQQLSAHPILADYSVGGNAGIYVKRRIRNFGIQLEVSASNAQYTTQYPVAFNYELSHTHYADSSTKGIFNALYLNVPLLLEVRPGEHFAFQFGAQYSYLLSFKDKNTAFAARYGTDQILNKSNIALVTGFELDIYKDFKMGARYAMGTSDMNAGKFKPLTDKWSANSAQVFFLYRFEKWGRR
ncbi:hypothetical protein CJD36_000135 [Flavipsychrobacter stenotrophus]|uniref:Outer membrane protein beta-barrel domain-containing protein n=1 Tax=Flavipsychrobacter stenotrophus TaxID=2077091 RepID=A0A2S7SZR9_9BACT|nr:hypothetical protein CJD36_000135 [Flavipsychrobacter stenotrophus]